ncbi:hypothetical protein C8T65DRAFT_726300 [Cerioporus squamosus]|nr:hypothetical protein C8T65DRAFT_726300 [Cerioporus squamosus]
MSELTTSKVNRQFRSLRSKCASLTSLSHAPPRPKVAVTYGSSSRNAPRLGEQDDAPPLAILQSLDKLGARLHFDRALVENMQLSKRIYEVRDAFKNIVQSTFGPPKPVSETPCRILPLAGICARVVGQHVEVEMAASLEHLPNAEGGQDEDRGQIMDELYEQVPSQYRNYTMVAHALTYILDTCPHHPTLLHALLEVCIAHGLFSEAQMILHALFTTAILPRPDSPRACPLTHPAHKNFLTTLRETSGGGAVVRLSRDLAQQDFAGCFVPLVSGLATSLWQSNKPQKGASKGGMEHSRSKVHEDALERLAKWLAVMLDTVYRSGPTTDGLEHYSACLDFLVMVEPFRFHTLAGPPASPGACVADALCCLAAYCLASPLAATASVQPDLRVLERLLREATIRNQTMDDLVSRILPLPSFTMFRMPLSELGEHTPTPPPVDLALGHGVIGDFDALATPLRARGLLRCEAALYRSALEHVEILISSPPHTLPPSLQLGEKALHELRLQLLDRAEDAERRCYGNATDPSRPPDASQEWVWEEMVGSWVVKSPAPPQAKIRKDRELERAAKRRRVDTASHHTLSDKLFKGSIFPSTRQSHSTSNVRSERPPLSRPVASLDKENSSDGEDYQDIGTDPLISGDSTVDDTPVPTRIRKFATTLGNVPRSTISFGAGRIHQNGAKPKPLPESPASASAPPRRHSNFATLIADSQKNAISLREEKARERARRAEASPSKKTVVHTDGILKRKRRAHTYDKRHDEPSDSGDDAARGASSVVERESSPVRGAEPSSDDALDLFAYPDSSPVASRRRGLY